MDMGLPTMANTGILAVICFAMLKRNDSSHSLIEWYTKGIMYHLLHINVLSILAGLHVLQCVLSKCMI